MDSSSPFFDDWYLRILKPQTNAAGVFNDTIG